MLFSRKCRDGLLKARRFVSALARRTVDRIHPLTSKALRCSWAFLREFIEQTFPIVPCIWAQHKIGKHLASLENSPALSAEDNAFLQLDVEILRNCHELEIKRRKDIQSRAQGNLAVVTVAVSLVLGLVSVTRSTAQPTGIPSPFSWLVVWPAVLSAIFLCVSAIASITILFPGQVYDVWLENAVQSEEEQKALYITMIKRNREETQILANYACASYICMRNGIIVIAIVLLLTVVKYANP